MEVWILINHSWSSNEPAIVSVYASREKALEARLKESKNCLWFGDQNESPESPESDEWIFYDNEITLEIKKKTVK